MHDILLASSNNTLASIPLVILYFIYIIIFILCIICILSTSCMFVCMHEIENDVHIMHSTSQLHARVCILL